MSAPSGKKFVKGPLKSGKIATSKATPFSGRKGQVAVKKPVTGMKHKNSAGVPKAKGDPLSKHHSFKEGTAAHTLNKRAVKKFNTADQDNGKALKNLHTKTSPKSPKGPSMRPGGKGVSKFSTMGY